MSARVCLLAAALALGGCAADPSEPAAPPRAYRVEYRVEEPASPTPVRTEALEVARPYGARVVTKVPGTPAHTVVQVADVVLTPTPQGLTVLPRVPGPPGPDLRLAALADAVDLGLAARGDNGRVAGRDCRWYRTAAPLDAQSFSPPTAAERTDSCVDAAGLLLADRWRLDGELVRARTATRVAIGPTPAITAPSVAAVTLPGAPELQRRRRPSPGYPIPPPAATGGFRLRHVVAMTQREPGAATPRWEGERWVYDDGLHVRWLEQRRTHAAAPAQADGTPVPVDGAPGATVVFGAQGVSLAWTVDGVSVVAGGTGTLAHLRDWIAGWEAQR